MTEYIDKNNLIADIIKEVKSDDEWKTADDILNIVRCYPTSDVRENVKGEWLHVVEEIEGTTFRGCRCSKCNYWKGMGIFNFCPNCGAEMREGRNDG